MEKRMDIEIDGIRIIAEKAEAEHFHFDCRNREYDGFVYFIKGEGELCAWDAAVTLPVCDGMLFWFRRGDSYRFRVKAGCRYITSAYCICRDEADSIPSRAPTAMLASGEQGLAIKQLAREWESHRPTSYMRCKIGLLSLYTELFGEKAPPSYAPAVRTAVEYIHKNFRRPFTGEELAAACALSPSHLRQCFRAALGMTVTEYRDSLRIAAAREMLASGLFTPKETAYELGYCDVYHFSKVFAAKVGMTPTRFSKKNS